ncbi:MAG TPA: hypothetical protein VGD67_23510 [Pseudonocardiaceae bacterium]
MLALRSPRHMLLLGLGLWVGLIVLSLVLLPLEGSTIHESLKLAGLVGLALAGTILYLRRRAEGGVTWAEGAVVGVLWAVVLIALDLALFATGAFNMGLVAYFADVASSYLAVPVVTVLAMGFLRTR